MALPQGPHPGSCKDLAQRRPIPFPRPQTVVFAYFGDFRPRPAGPPNFFSDYDVMRVHLLESAKKFGGPGRLQILDSEH